jgi:signal transduction histidine kinase
MSCHVLCAHSDPGVVRRLERALRDLTGGILRIGVHADAASLLAAGLHIQNHGEDVAMVFCDLPIAGMAGDDLFRSLKGESSLRGTRRILLDTAADPQAVDELLQRGVMHARLDPEFEEDRLKKLLKGQLTDFVVNIAPHLMDDLHTLLDLPVLAGALGSAKENLERLNSRLREVNRSVIGDDHISDEQVETAMIEEFDRILDHPERHAYMPEEVMVRQGDEAGTIWIILQGRVKLYRTIDGEDVIFHSESAGRIVGLMSLSLQNPVFFSCRAATEVTALVLSRDQVRHAIRENPVLSHYLITVIMRSMARRNARAAELQTEVLTLNRKLAQQRDELAATLTELRRTQDRLVDSAKMATLGNLAAGMAHELNNPVSAMLRATAHLGEDLDALLAAAPELAAAARTIPLARATAPLSTREERELRRNLAKELGIDPNDAARLVEAGIQSGRQFKELSGSDGKADRKQLVADLARAGQIGSALRNITNCATRIAELVRSLRMYTRDDKEYAPGTDINQTLDDVLLILANRVKRVALRKEYGVLPGIRANPSQLQQVWTNLISNALHALDGRGALTVRTAAAGHGGVRVEIEDSGPGIPPEARDRLFEARFTTKDHRVEFGLGLGLPIVRSIVRQHGGDITFTSEPGRTVFTVELPASPDQPLS